MLALKSTRALRQCIARLPGMQRGVDTINFDALCTTKTLKSPLNASSLVQATSKAAAANPSTALLVPLLVAATHVPTNACARIKH